MKLSREPAVWGALLIAVVSILATWPNKIVDGNQLPLVIAVVDGAVALVVAVMVRPVGPAVLIGVTTPLAALLSGYGVDLPPGLIGTVNLILVPALLGLVARSQQTPKADSAPTAPIEGPVR